MIGGSLEIDSSFDSARDWQLHHAVVRIAIVAPPAHTAWIGSYRMAQKALPVWINLMQHDCL